MRILALSSWWPEPADNGARLRIARLIRALAAEHEVHLIALAQEPVAPGQLASMATQCASAAAIPHAWYTPQRQAVLGSLLYREPASIRATYSQAFAAAAVERFRAVQPDLVIAFELAAAAYVPALPRTPRLFEEVEVAVLHEQWSSAASAAQKARRWLTWSKHRRYLQRLLAQFDACTVVSAAEKALVAALDPALQVHVLPNGADVEVAAQAGTPEHDTLIYPGALSYSANRDAVAYFVEQIWPLVRQARPNARLRVTGRTTDADRLALGAAGVEWTGYVADIRAEIARTWAEVVPLRIGGGTRLKVLEALATGTPVVATSKGVEGLAVRDDQHVLIADSPAEFAAATVRLLECPELRARLVAEGRRLVGAEYDWRRIGAQLRALVHDLVVPGQQERV